MTVRTCLIALMPLFLGACALSPLSPLEHSPMSLNNPKVEPTLTRPQRGPTMPAPSMKSANDIFLGMETDGVQASWGRPEQVEVAGHPSQGHQRWTYSKEIPSANGYIREKRIIYFENYRVVGWRTQQL